ncbi:DUF2642 domain-containing protein [Fictibacillus gelatini]|nr:DUF2642 domain-containing protein [Fictibacillus gelatini]
MGFFGGGCGCGGVGGNAFGHCDTFRREARRLINERVQVDTERQVFRGRLVMVGRDIIIVQIRVNGCNERAIIRICEIIALFPI